MRDKFRSFWSSDDPAVIRKRQYLLASGVIGILFGVLGVFSFWGGQAPRPVAAAAPEKAKEIESSGTRIAPEEMWRFRMEEENKSLKDALQKLQASLEAAQQEEKHRQDRAAYEQKVESTLTDLQHQLVQKTAPVVSPEPPTFSDGGAQGPEVSPIQKVIFSQGKITTQDRKTVHNTIPAGAFVRAVLLSGVDVSTALQSSTDPRPLLVRLVDHGTLPRRFKSDLKDCHLTVAAYGDLSSERVYGRLEKLSCVVRKTGEILETQVTGYVAGPDGKAGLRGKVVSKEGAFLERSLVGGLLSGLSSVANPQNRQSLVNPFSAGNPKVDGPSASNLFASGMAEGTSDALDRLSRYYISRAEQLQPVIQIPAGQILDVVFTQGVSFGPQEGKAQTPPVATGPVGRTIQSPAENTPALSPNTFPPRGS